MLLLETLSAVTVPNADAGQALRRRYLALFLQALHAPGATPLPGPTADPADLRGPMDRDIDPRLSMLVRS